MSDYVTTIPETERHTPNQPPATVQRPVPADPRPVAPTPQNPPATPTK